MDYKDSANYDGIEFPVLYARSIQALEKAFGLETYFKDISNGLRKKRQLGVEKYGEFSFQSSLNKALAAPTIEHLKEELLDAMNYLLHEHFKASILYPSQLKAIENAITEMKNFYNNVLTLENDIDKLTRPGVRLA